MSDASPDIEQSPAVLRLAAHPLRWRLLSALARSDRSVQELCVLAGEPQNLVSYHLARLRDGGLVSARRSSADGRDSYYSAALSRIGEALSAAAGALHPALAPTPQSKSALSKGRKRVLFLCTGNSARSQMAEAFVKVKSGGAVNAVSAGSHPKPLHPNAQRVMRDEYGVDLTGLKPKHLERFAGQRFDCVITLCDRVREVCPEFPGSPDSIHWSIANPATDEPDAATLPAFRQTAHEIADRVDYLLAALAEHNVAPQPSRRPA